MKTTNRYGLLHLSKEELIEKLHAQEKELTIQHDLLKQTFFEHQKLQQRFKQLETQALASTEGYDPSASWVSKIVFALQKEKKPLKSSELIAVLERREPMLLNHHSKEKYFSAFLNTAVKYGRIGQQTVKGVRGYYYLLPEWFDDAGAVKCSYKEMMI